MEHRKAAERLAQQQQQAAHASTEEVARLTGWIGKDFIGGAGECVLIRRYGRGLIPVPRSRHHANMLPC